MKRGGGVYAFGLEYQDDLVSAIKEYIFMESRVLKANNKKVLNMFYIWVM